MNRRRLNSRRAFLASAASAPVLAGMAARADDPSRPNIDSIARQGVQFTHLYTYPFCSSTRAGIMTGRSPARFGLIYSVIRPWSYYGLPQDERTLAEILLPVPGTEPRTNVLFAVHGEAVSAPDLLFNVETDPLEKTGRAAPEPDLVPRLAAKIEEWLALHPKCDIDRSMNPHPGWFPPRDHPGSAVERPIQKEGVR